MRGGDADADEGAEHGHALQSGVIGLRSCAANDGGGDELAFGDFVHSILGLAVAEVDVRLGALVETLLLVLVVATVDGDDTVSHGLGVLHAQASNITGSTRDQHPATGDCIRLLDGCVGSNSGTHDRRLFLGHDVVGQEHEVRLGNRDEPSQGAGNVNATPGLVLAVNLTAAGETSRAGVADAADPADTDARARLDSGGLLDGRTELDDVTDALVAKYVALVARSEMTLRETRIRTTDANRVDAD